MYLAKDSLVGMFAAIFLLHNSCLPMMSFARSKIEELQEENISDKKEVIDLKSRLISIRERELGTVSSTVKKEIKSYSSILQESCTTALSPKKIATAVKTIVKEEDRSKEVVVCGVDVS